VILDFLNEADEKFLTKFSGQTIGPTSGVPKIFVWGGGGQEIQLRTEDRGNGDLVAVAP